MTCAHRFLLTAVVCLAVLVAAAPMAAQSITFTTSIDFSSTVPNTSGATFTNLTPIDPCLPNAPVISNGNTAFWGTGGSEQGVYALRYGTLAAIADLSTNVPPSSGGLGTFVAQPQDPCSPSDAAISGGNVAFRGYGASSAGIYVRPATNSKPSDPCRYATNSTAIPGSIDTFSDFLAPAISGLSAAFIGSGSGGEQGVYAVLQPSDPCIPGDPIRIADLTTAIPNGGGAVFSGWTPNDPIRISGSSVAFVGGNASTGLTGVYFSTPGGALCRAVDSTITSSYSFSSFSGFSSVAIPPDPIMPTSLAFVASAGSVDIPLQGVYMVAWNPSDPCHTVSAPARIADFSSAVPGAVAGARFTAFGNVAIDPTRVVFDAWYTPDNGATEIHGLFTNMTGTLTRLLDTTQTLGGKALADFRFGSGGYDSNQVTFAASFTDGSQSIATATVSGNKCPQSQGYWKNNPSAWPENVLTLGNQIYSKSQLLSILGTSTTSDASLVLARQLIAAKLNVLRFSPAVAQSTILDSDRLLAAYAGLLPYNVGTSSTNGKPRLNDSNTLKNYNSDALTPSCTP